MGVQGDDVVADEVLAGLVLELRRGTLVLSVLTQLRRPMYGYSLIQSLTDEGLSIDQGTLYPLLRRLEKQGLLSSDWSVEESRPRRYYVLSPDGVKVLADLTEEWHRLSLVVESLLDDGVKEQEDGSR
jgi:DNA-binding PadR family transcriptional regulator